MFTQIRKVIAASLILVLILGLAAFAQTQQRPGAFAKQRAQISNQGQQTTQGFAGRHRPHGRMACLQRVLLPPNRRELEQIAISLGLTDDQKQQIKELYKQFRDTIVPILEERGPAVHQVLDTLQQPSPSKGELQSAANQVLQADRAILDAEFDFWLAFRSILNPQQQTGINQLLEQRKLGHGAQPQMKRGTQQGPRQGAQRPMRQANPGGPGSVQSDNFDFELPW